MREGIDAVISAAYRSDWGRILATVIRLTGDFTLAEEATQEAFAAAVGRWRDDGVPEHPRAWLIQTARNMAIDRIRRKKVLASKLETYAADLDGSTPEAASMEIADDRLRLIFTCCHPALALEAQVALTLRTLVGMETEEIARAFVVPVTTMAQRLVRAKRKIADAGIPYVVPETTEMPQRLPAVLTVLYLVFNEGYAATRGASMLRLDLSAEAIRLARVVRALTGPDPPGEVTGILALMLLHDSRRDARLDDAGELVLLDEQDRGRWDQEQIAEALLLVDEGLRGEPGPFALQAAITAEHSRAKRKEDTDWAKVLRLYDRLEQVQPSAVVALNRAVAVAMVDGPAAALGLVDALTKDGALEEYHLLHAVHADFSRRIGAFADAEASYARALELVGNDSERRFLARRLHEVRHRTKGPAGTPGKAALRAELARVLEADLAASERSYHAAKQAATHEEARPENDKDTRALEQSYLARGGAIRVEALRAALTEVHAMPMHGADDVVCLGALVTTDEASETRRVWIAPCGGGVRLAAGTVQVITPQSPLARALLGKRRGDQCEVELAGRTRVLVIVSVE
jgi:RNA polymerase sigma-70 factor (ECF subfamily)